MSDVYQITYHGTTYYTTSESIYKEWEGLSSQRDMAAKISNWETSGTITTDENSLVETGDEDDDATADATDASASSTEWSGEESSNGITYDKKTLTITINDSGDQYVFSKSGKFKKAWKAIVNNGDDPVSTCESYVKSGYAKLKSDVDDAGVTLEASDENPYALDSDLSADSKVDDLKTAHEKIESELAEIEADINALSSDPTMDDLDSIKDIIKNLNDLDSVTSELYGYAYEKKDGVGGTIKKWVTGSNAKIDLRQDIADTQTQIEKDMSKTVEKGQAVVDEASAEAVEQATEFIEYFEAFASGEIADIDEAIKYAGEFNSQIDTIIDVLDTLDSFDGLEEYGITVDIDADLSDKLDTLTDTDSDNLVQTALDTYTEEITSQIEGSDTDSLDSLYTNLKDLEETVNEANDQGINISVDFDSLYDSIKTAGQTEIDDYYAEISSKDLGSMSSSELKALYEELSKKITGYQGLSIEGLDTGELESLLTTINTAYEETLADEAEAETATDSSSDNSSSSGCTCGCSSSGSGSSSDSSGSTDSSTGSSSDSTGSSSGSSTTTGTGSSGSSSTTTTSSDSTDSTTTTTSSGSGSSTTTTSSSTYTQSDVTEYIASLSTNYSSMSQSQLLSLYTEITKKVAVFENAGLDVSSLVTIQTNVLQAYVDSAAAAAAASSASASSSSSSSSSASLKVSLSVAVQTQQTVAHSDTSVDTSALEEAIKELTAKIEELEGNSGDTYNYYDNSTTIIDNSRTDNSYTDNSYTDNSYTDNSDNSTTDNSYTDNSDNSYTDNSYTDNSDNSYTDNSDNSTTDNSYTDNSYTDNSYTDNSDNSTTNNDNSTTNNYTTEEPAEEEPAEEEPAEEEPVEDNLDPDVPVGDEKATEETGSDDDSAPAADDENGDSIVDESGDECEDEDGVRTDMGAELLEEAESEAAAAETAEEYTETSITISQAESNASDAADAAEEAQEAADEASGTEYASAAANAAEEAQEAADEAEEIVEEMQEEAAAEETVTVTVEEPAAEEPVEEKIEDNPDDDVPIAADESESSNDEDEIDIEISE